ncbi:MAG: hypothetical protein ACJAS4_001574 [Bacteriovoracaceae bacterium]|jgi:hypothetical protein
MKVLKYNVYIILLVTTNIFAGIGGLGGGAVSHMEKEEWGKLNALVKSNKELKLEGTNVFVGSILSVFKACLTPEKIRTKEKMPVFKKVYVGKSRDNDNHKDGWVSKEVGRDYRDYPREKIEKQAKCNSRGKKCRDIFVKKVLDPVSTIKLKAKFYSTQEKFQELYVKDYHIPDCKE